MSVYSKYVTWIYFSTSRREDLQTSTELKKQQEYSTLACPYYVNEISKKVIVLYYSCCETSHKQEKQAIIATSSDNASKKQVGYCKGCHLDF